MSTVSIIICTRNRYQDVIRCLESLRWQTRRADEIVIVDASDDEYLGSIVNTLFSSAFADCRIVRGVRGLTRQRNIGIRETAGDYVFFLDDDVVLSPDYIKKMVRVFEQEGPPRFGGGMGQIVRVESPSRWQRGLQRFFYLGEVCGHGRFKPSGFPVLPHGRSDFLEVECLSGANMCFRREVVQRYGFDEALHDYAYMEDDDYAYRVSRAYKLFYEPQAQLEHRHSASGRLHNRVLKRMLIRNHRYLFRKNFPQTFQTVWAHRLSVIGVMLQCLLDFDVKGFVGAAEGVVDETPSIR